MTKAKNALDCKKIINICEQNQKLFPKNRKVMYTDGYTKEQLSYIMQKNINEDIQIARQKYQSVQEFRTQLITLRDKHLAHTDKKVFLYTKDFYNEVSLKGEALEKLIETASDITNLFLSNLSDTVVHTEFHNVDDYEKILRYVKEGKEAYLQKIKSKNN